MLEGTEVRTGISYREFLRDNREKQSPDTWDKVLYTGMIDEYFDFRLGALEYRSLRFETEELPDEDNFQGNAVVNYTDEAVPYTRIIEHKHFEFGTQHGTVITKEYPAEWKPGDEPYYPVNDDKNRALYAGYRELAQQDKLKPIADIARERKSYEYLLSGYRGKDTPPLSGNDGYGEAECAFLSGQPEKTGFFGKNLKQAAACL